MLLAGTQVMAKYIIAWLHINRLNMDKYKFVLKQNDAIDPFGKF